MARSPAVLASGTGSLFEAMLAEGLPIKLLVTDRECRAMEIAHTAKVPVFMLPRSFKRDQEFDRVAYTRSVIQLLRKYDIDLVIMAGYMTVFAAPMFQEGGYAGHILNTHPSLLPSFKGDHAVRDALQFGAKVTGCTIHQATAELDAGPILAQRAVEILPDDTVETLHERIKVIERKLYPEVIRQLLD